MTKAPAHPSGLQMEFTQRLRRRRMELGLSKQELAAQVGVSQTTIQQYESRQLPKGEYAVRLAEALRCSLDWLLAGRGDAGGDVLDTAEARLVMVPMVEARAFGWNGQL